jgi:hypothetical protein
MGMRMLEQILYEKELELARVRQQVEALKFILPLLIEPSQEAPGNEPTERNRWPLQLG